MGDEETIIMMLMPSNEQSLPPSLLALIWTHWPPTKFLVHRSRTERKRKKKRKNIFFGSLLSFFLYEPEPSQLRHFLSSTQISTEPNHRTPKENFWVLWSGWVEGWVPPPDWRNGGRCGGAGGAERLRSHRHQQLHLLVRFWDLPFGHWRLKEITVVVPDNLGSLCSLASCPILSQSELLL